MVKGQGTGSLASSPSMTVSRIPARSNIFPSEDESPQNEQTTNNFTSTELQDNAHAEKIVRYESAR